MDLGFIREASLFGLVGLLVSATPFLAAVWYALRPNETRLARMRPLTLAGIFASVSNLLLGLANSLQATGLTGPDGQPYRATDLLAEGLIPSFVGFAFLTVAWLLIAIATRKTV